MLRAELRVELGTFSIEGSLEATGLTLLEGENGAGKTTFLRGLLGVVPTTSGKLECRGKVLLDSEKEISIPAEDRRFGYVPQRSGLLPHLDVRRNLELSLASFRGEWSSPLRRAKLEAALDLFSLRGLEKKNGSALSGGERQRVALARSLVIEPTALVLDEPFSSLDAEAKLSLGNLLAERLESLRIPAVLVNHGSLPAGLAPSRTFSARAGRVGERFGSPAEE